MSFITVEPFIINDPLTNGRTVGRQIGGAFVAGGWQSRSLTDGIDYDVPTCVSCRLEFDLSNVGATEGFAFERDLKVVSMGDAAPDASAPSGSPGRCTWCSARTSRQDGKSSQRNGGTDQGDGSPVS
jgi:hypothetical protein